MSKLPESEPCFVVFDFHEPRPDGRIVKKVVLIKWYVVVAVVRLGPVVTP